MTSLTPTQNMRYSTIIPQNYGSEISTSHTQATSASYSSSEELAPNTLFSSRTSQNSDVVAVPNQIEGYYTGELSSDNRPHGKGIFTTNAGYTYEGSWISGTRHGYGASTFNGRTLLENWHFGRRNELIGEYVGKTLFGLPHGNGKMMSPDGFCYMGQWVEGLLHGFGVLNKNNLNILALWENGQLKFLFNQQTMSFNSTDQAQLPPPLELPAPANTNYREPTRPILATRSSTNSINFFSLLSAISSNAPANANPSQSEAIPCASRQEQSSELSFNPSVIQNPPDEHTLGSSNSYEYSTKRQKMGN